MAKVLKLSRGELKTNVMTAIIELGRDAYPTKMNEIISKKHNRATMLPQVVTTLKRLEKTGAVYVVGTQESPSRRRPRTIYGLTEDGMAVFEAKTGKETTQPVPMNLSSEGA